jgi:protoporphyrinogen/coproporphyrinogen III oxidase
VLIRNVKDDFRRYMQITEPPLGVRVFRWPHAGVQLEVGHLNLMSDIDARLGSVPGLFVSGAGFRGVGIADCVADARTQATRAAAYSEAVGVRAVAR